MVLFVWLFFFLWGLDFFRFFVGFFSMQYDRAIIAKITVSFSAKVMADPTNHLSDTELFYSLSHSLTDVLVLL